MEAIDSLELMLVCSLAVTMPPVLMVEVTSEIGCVAISEFVTAVSVFLVFGERFTRVLIL